jgi:hypothetical protein
MRNRDDRPWREHHPHGPREFDQGGRRAHFRGRGAHENDEDTFGHGPAWPAPHGAGPAVPERADDAGAPGPQGYPSAGHGQRRRRGAPQVVSWAEPGRPRPRGGDTLLASDAPTTSGYDDYGSEALYGTGFEDGDWPRTFRRGAHRSRARSLQPAADHRGKGPQGYQRSDERLLDEVHQRLTDDDYLDARRISVSVSDGVVHLDGSVARRWMKHHAEHVAARCYGVVDVDNRIRVEGRG